MQQSQRSRSHSINSRNREALLVMTASAALLAGLTTSIEALPFNQQPVGQSETWPPAKAKAKAKAKGKALTARAKASAKPESEDLAAKANGVLTVVISIDKQQLTLYSGRPSDRALARLDRRAGPSDADRRIQHHREGSLAPLQPLRQRPDVLHAADHLVRRGHAPGRRSQLSGVARLHPAARGIRQANCGASRSSASALSSP